MSYSGGNYAVKRVPCLDCHGEGFHELGDALMYGSSAFCETCSGSGQVVAWVSIERARQLEDALRQLMTRVRDLRFAEEHGVHTKPSAWREALLIAGRVLGGGKP